jgi:hypothetical protein
VLLRSPSLSKLVNLWAVLLAVQVDQASDRWQSLTVGGMTMSIKSIELMIRTQPK